MSDVAKTPREELECKKKYLYEYSMFWECNDGSKCQILEEDVCEKLNEQQATINELQSIINHIKCEENCEDYDYCCETVCSLYNEIKHLKEDNEKLRKQCFELEKDYVIETSDISDKIYLDDEITELKKKYGVKNE